MDDMLALALSKSKSWKQLAFLLGYTTVSGSILNKLKKDVDRLNLSYAHFAVPKQKPQKYTVQTGLIKFEGGSSRISGRVLTRLLLEIGRQYNCEICGNAGLWNGKKLKLQVDHKDGNPWNNVPENLRFLCPNCHTQTLNWGCKNIKKRPVITKDSDWGNRHVVSQRNSTRVGLIENSKIDFSKWGWVKEVSILLGMKHQKVSKWMKKHMPLQYAQASTRELRKVKNARELNERVKTNEKIKLSRTIDVEREIVLGKGWIARLSVLWGVSPSSVRVWVKRNGSTEYRVEILKSCFCCQRESPYASGFCKVHAFSATKIPHVFPNSQRNLPRLCDFNKTA